MSETADGEAERLATLRAELATALQAGVAHHGAGRLDEAYDAYAAVLERDPANADALHLSGAVRLSQGRVGEAVARIWEAVGLAPEFPQAWNTLGLGLRAEGRFDAAIACLQRAVEQAPGDPLLLCNLGGVLWDAGRRPEAAAVLRQACTLAPQLIEAQVALGKVSLELGQADQALASFSAAHAQQPERVEALAGLGAALLLVGDPAAAETMLRQAAAAAPGDPGVGTDLARALLRQGQGDAAEALLREVLATLPGHVPALLDLGFVLQARGDLGGAVSSFRAAAEAAPEMPAAQMALALALSADGLWPEALACFERAAVLRPEDPAMHMGRASALQMLERRAEAAEACRAALALNPDLPEAHASLGVILQELGELEAAVASHRKALTLRPELVDERCSLSHALRDLGQLDEAAAQARLAVSQLPGKGFAHATLGFALLAQGHIDEAEASLRTALALPAEGPEQVCSAGMIRLLLGELPAGFVQYEARWLRPSMASNPIRRAGPVWDGSQDVSGRTLLLYCEQGLGDTLQFLRFVPMVAARGARVKLAVQAPLASLAAGLPGVAELCPLDQGVPAFDLHSPLVSLPGVLGVGLAALPGEVPYLAAAPKRVADWATRLRPAPMTASASLFAEAAPDQGKLLRVGLAWSGSAGHSNDRNRSMALRQLAPLLAVPGCRFHMVQTELREGDRAALAASGMVDARGLIGDMGDTAALLANIDLVISVDTAPAHLAGALGRPLWLMLPAVPDWRWLLRREDSPWYPTARLFRQRAAGDWQGVVAEVAAALGAAVRAHR